MIKELNRILGEKNSILTCKQTFFFLEKAFPISYKVFFISFFFISFFFSSSPSVLFFLFGAFYHSLDQVWSQPDRALKLKVFTKRNSS